MPKNPVTRDGLTVPDFSTWEANPAADVKICAQAWFDHTMELATTYEAGGRTPLASEAREMERACSQLEAFGEAYMSAKTKEQHRIDQRSNLIMPPSTLTEPGGLRYEDASERDAFRGYLRTGNDAELRAQGVATGAAGGYLVPQAFRNYVAETMKAFGSVRAVSEVIRTTDGADMPFPTNDDTTNIGAILGENTQVTEQDLTLGTKTLRAYAYTSKMVRVSLQLLQDSAFDLDPWLARKLAQRIGRAQNPHFTTGTGTAQPEGIQTNATVGKTGIAGQTTTVIYDDLVDLVHSVDPAYRAAAEDCAWMMGDATLAAVRKLKDTTGQPLLEPDIKAGLPNTLLGYRVVVNPDMPAMAANAKSILFGNFRAGYVIRDSADFSLLRLVERYADFLQHGFLGWQRSDGLVQDASAYKAYRNAAT